MSTLEASGKTTPPHRRVRFSVRQMRVAHRAGGAPSLRGGGSRPRIGQRSFADFIPFRATLVAEHPMPMAEPPSVDPPCRQPQASHIACMRQLHANS
ncbi:hypothetical protein [Caballeronia sp. J97]|uniref:hypothetical protein n=1 Tax=Caballeronia sp. J97 TaxID=2805429 RepID=UPI002AAF3E85|nr:hypothetical protein [Caballeronia sp. J97]